MSQRTGLIMNAVLAAVGIAGVLAFNLNAGLLITALVLGLHLRRLKAQEWRVLIQLSVMGWIVDSVLLRMNMLTNTSEIESLSRVLCWTIFASAFCHSLYPMIRKFWAAAIVGVFWGLLLYGLPIALAYYQSDYGLITMLIVSSLSCALITVLFSFIINTRILPQQQLG